MRPLALRTVLVATDLSDHLLPALRTAAQLATLAGGRVHIVHATEKKGDESALTKHVEAAGVKGDVLADARIVQGPSGATITQEAWRTEADVIVLGPHRSTKASSLGSTADRVVRAAPAPCLILPVPLPLPLGRVLVPVDVAEGAKGPLSVGMAWASALRRRGKGGTGTCVVALHVSPEQSESKITLDALQREVSDVRDRLAQMAGVEVEELLEHGDAATTILKHADSGSFDLLVLGTRGERDVSGDLLGSVSSAVVQRVSIAVLLVPPAIWKGSAGDPLP